MRERCTKIVTVPAATWKTHQGAAVVSVCGSYQHSRDAVEPVAIAVFDDGVSAARHAEGIRSGGDRNGKRPGRDDPYEAVEDWWPNFGERPADLHRVVGIVSLPASVRTRSGEHSSSITDTAADLTLSGQQDSAADARSRRGVSGVLRTITKIRESIVEHSRRCDMNAGQLPQRPAKKHAAPKVPAV